MEDRFRRNTDNRNAGANFNNARSDKAIPSLGIGFKDKEVLLNDTQDHSNKSQV